MLRLAFDFIITWRETRTRPNAYGTDILFAQPYSATLNAPTVDSSILLHPSTFLYALLFCFVLNLLSSGIPAWRASRTSIVNALGGRIH